MTLKNKKTWIWIVVAVLGVGLTALIAIAGAGVYFVMSHIQTERAASADALRSFDAVRASFPNAQPLFELEGDEPRAVRRMADLPTSGSKPERLWILAWDAEDERLVKMSLPLWILRFGRGKVSLAKDRRELALDRLDLDVEELERIGPMLLFDVRDLDGARVLLWTE